MEVLSKSEAAQTSATAKILNVMQVTWGLVAGGAEMYAFTVAANLDARRFNSLMCAVDKGGALEPEIEARGIAHFVMHRRNGIDWKLMWRLYRLFKTNDVQVIHTHHFNQLFYSLLGAKLTGARLVHMEHSVEFLKRKRLAIALKVLSFFCDKVIAIGTDGATALREKAGIAASKLEIIRAGVDPANYTESKQQARAALEIDEAAKIVVMVARLFPEKNHQMLLQAFAEVVKKLPAAKLLMVGDGVEEAAIRAMIDSLNLKAQVEMLGVRRDVPRLLAAADLFVLSSDREGLPIAVLEAMAAAKPIVATAVGDIPMVVQDRHTGRVVPPNDAASFAAAMLEILRDDDKTVQMGAQGRMAVEAYSLQAMIRRFEALYAEPD